MKRRHKVLMALCLGSLLAGGLFRWATWPKPVPTTVHVLVCPADRSNDPISELFRRYGSQQPDRLAWLVRRAAERYGLDPALVAGVVVVESSARPDAISKCRARGLMQVRFAVWGRALMEQGIAFAPLDLHDPHRGILAGCYVLRHYLDRHGDVRTALNAYSGGARGYADKVMGVTM